MRARATSGLWKTALCCWRRGAAKNVLTAWQERKREEIERPFLKERASLGLFPHLQANLLARTLRGDLDAYPALIWK